MQLRNIRPFGQHRPAHLDDDGNKVPADVVEVPDGAEFDPFHYEAVEPADPPPPAAPDPAPASPGEALAAEGLPTTAALQFPYAPKEM